MVRPKIRPALTITKLLGKAFGKKWLIKQVCSNNPTPPVASLTDGARRPNQLGAVATIWASSRLFPKWSFLWSASASCLPPPTDCPKPSGRSWRPLAIRFITGARITARRDQNSQIWVLTQAGVVVAGGKAELRWIGQATLPVYDQQPRRHQCRPAEGPLGNKAIN